jgi:hypothetical protein
LTNPCEDDPKKGSNAHPSRIPARPAAPGELTKKKISSLLTPMFLLVSLFDKLNNFGSQTAVILFGKGDEHLLHVRRNANIQIFGFYIGSFDWSWHRVSSFLI